MLVSHVHIKDLALTQTYNLGRCKIHCSNNITCVHIFCWIGRAGHQEQLLSHHPARQMGPKRKANTLNKWNCHQSKALAHLLQVVLLRLLGNGIIHLLLFQEDVCHRVLLLLREWQWKVWGNSCLTMTVRSVHPCPLCGEPVITLLGSYGVWMLYMSPCTRYVQ